MSARADRRPVRHESAPLSRPLFADDVPDEGLDFTIEANADECAAVANQIGLPSIGALAANVHVARRPGGRLEVDGIVRATITQMCVVSLEPFESEIVQQIEICFAPSASARPDRNDRAGPSGALRRRRVEVPEPPDPPPAAPAEDDPPDPIVDNRIDLGMVAVEFLTLGLDFYPKKPGVRFTVTALGDADLTKPSAFAALERLKDRS